MHAWPGIRPNIGQDRPAASTRVSAQAIHTAALGEQRPCRLYVCGKRSSHRAVGSDRRRVQLGIAAGQPYGIARRQGGVRERGKEGRARPERV